MQNWRREYKIAAITIAIVVLIGVVCGANDFNDGFGLILGIVCLVGSLLGFFVAFVSYLASSKQVAKGFLLSAGVLLLLSGISCGTGLSNMNFH